MKDTFGVKDSDVLKKELQFVAERMQIEGRLHSFKDYC